jgi:hypothetical protein
MKKILGQTHTRARRTVLTIALSATLGACGGGGGDVNQPPRFEPTTVGSTAAVRDNQTGIVWAAGLGSNGLPNGSTEPTASELLQLTDLGASELRPYFGFVLDAASPLIKAKEDVKGVVGRVWAGDFGVRGPEPGGLSDEATAVTPDVPDYENWYVLSRRSVASAVVYPSVSVQGTVSAAGLSWKFCSEGSTWNGTGCNGQPTRVPASGAQALANATNAVNFAGRADWRLPTPQELRSLLQLEKDANSGNLLPDSFAGDPGAADALPQYWTNGRASNGTLAWLVDFSGGIDPGGIELVPVDDQAYVRLVRTSR